MSAEAGKVTDPVALAKLAVLLAPALRRVVDGERAARATKRSAAPDQGRRLQEVSGDFDTETPTG